jgi:hypothetical protein
MHASGESLRHQVALGWVMQLLMLITMFQMMTVNSILADTNFQTLRKDPGKSLAWLVYLLAIYALMPMVVYLVDGLRPRVFRWLAVALSCLGFLFFLLHHLGHWYMGQRPTFGSHVLDLSLHLNSLWVIVSSIRWARVPPEEAP